MIIMITGIDCGLPPDVENANVSLVDNGTLYSDVASYECHLGFSITPTNASDKTFTSTCQSNHNWTDRPMCKGTDEPME